MNNIKLIIGVCILLSCSAVKAQFNSFIDPAIAYNKVLGEKGNNGRYQNIGAFKVVGSPYIYSETMRGDVYHDGKVAKDVIFKINNYSKELQVATNVPGQYFMVSIKNLDSLTLTAEKNELLNTDLKFLSSVAIDNKKELFLQELQKGPRFTLYKSYATELAIPSDNYIQSDLREYKLQVNYFYVDNQVAGTLNSINPNKKSLAKVFKANNAAEILDNVSLTGNLDLAMTKFFTYLK